VLSVSFLEADLQAGFLDSLTRELRLTGFGSEADHGAKSPKKVASPIAVTEHASVMRPVWAHGLNRSRGNGASQLG
jgi:hypothetical protein